MNATPNQNPSFTQQCQRVATRKTNLPTVGKTLVANQNLKSQISNSKSTDIAFPANQNLKSQISNSKSTDIALPANQNLKSQISNSKSTDIDLPANQNLKSQISNLKFPQAAPHIARPALPRRAFLRGTGAAALALPLLDAMRPAFSKENATPPKRFVAICAGLGFHAPHFFPEQEGRDYTPSPYLDLLKEHRDHFTVFSGLSHPDQQGNNGHASELTWLTSAPRPGLAGFRNTLSVDQLIADHLQGQTRFPYLALSTGGGSLAWTGTGVEIPAQSSPAKLFKSMFVQGTDADVKSELQSLRRGRSILDTVLGEARKLNRDLGHRDREKLDQYLISVRGLERRLQENTDWVQRPKPTTDAAEPKDITDKHDALGKQRLMYDMMALALQSDTTRVITLRLSGLNAPPILPGVSNDWHNLSHHGKDETKIDELKLIETAEFDALNTFLTRLREPTESGRPLLDHTAVLFGSNLGNASAHNWRNLPLLLAGGGYRHGAHVAHDADNNTPFANLLLTLAQNLGVETDQFGSSTSNSIRGFTS